MIPQTRKYLNITPVTEKNTPKPRKYLSSTPDSEKIITPAKISAPGTSSIRTNDSTNTEVPKHYFRYRKKYPETTEVPEQYPDSEKLLYCVLEGYVYTYPSQARESLNGQ
jgi:hypothetical protein